MNWLDLFLVVSAVSFGLSGYRQGFVVGVLSFAGFLGGGMLGMAFAPDIVGGLDVGLRQSLFAIAIVLVFATLGQLLATWLGAMVRDRITWEPARVVDAGMGALVSVLAMLLVSWFLASALRPGPSTALSRQISDSSVITGVDRVMPEEARTLFSSFRRVLDHNGLPTVFGGLSPERIRAVQPPDESAKETAAVRQARRSIVKITGSAQSCSRRLEGSGFVFSRHHVMTNAHVVAGVRRPRVQVGGEGTRYTARVVVYDSRRDLAVLYVPDLDAPVLQFQGGAERGDSAVVAGFPQGGPYRLGAARVRDTIEARGPDIYEREQVTREVFSLFADVEPGNSGGPLLAPDGDVYGVVFAKSLDDPETGYALTADEVAPVVRAGQGATGSVATGSCA
ncbi:MAG TPA: MarP family serine protease [Actinomycetes bacterium]